MKKKIAATYFDKELNREIKKDEVIEITEDRIEELNKAGIGCLDIDEDIDLLDLFLKNREIAKALKADQLKELCEHYKIEYSNATTAKEDLLALEIKEK